MGGRAELTLENIMGQRFIEKLALTTSSVENDMGWLFEMYDSGRANFLERLTSRSHFGETCTPLKARVVGNHVWQAVRHEPTGQVFIHLHLIAKDRNGGWGYKDMSEDAGPYCYDCPLSLLALCSEPTSDYAKEWREKVRAYHARRKALPKQVPGLIVKSGSYEYQLLEKLAPRKGWRVKEVDTGATYRMPAAQLSRALARMGEA